MEITIYTSLQNGTIVVSSEKEYVELSIADSEEMDLDKVNISLTVREARDVICGIMAMLSRIELDKKEADDE